MVDSKFGATVSDAGGLLSDGDLAVINATTVPEPETWTMLGTGLVGEGFCEDEAGDVARPAQSCCRSGMRCADVLRLRPGAGFGEAERADSRALRRLGRCHVTGSGFPAGTVLPGNVLVREHDMRRGSRRGGGFLASRRGTTVTVEIAACDVGGGTYCVEAGEVRTRRWSTAGRLASFRRRRCEYGDDDVADWKISNGALNIDFNTVRPRIFGLYPAGTTDNLIDLTNSDSMGPKGF